VVVRSLATGVGFASRVDWAAWPGVGYAGLAENAKARRAETVVSSRLCSRGGLTAAELVV